MEEGNGEKGQEVDMIAIPAESKGREVSGGSQGSIAAGIRESTAFVLVPHCQKLVFAGGRRGGGWGGLGFGFVFLILTKWKCEDGLEQKTLQEHVLRGWKKSDRNPQRDPGQNQWQSKGKVQATVRNSGCSPCPLY